MTHRIPMPIFRLFMLMLGVSLTVFSCQKEVEITQPQNSSGVEAYMDKEITETDEFPAFRELSEKDIQMIVDRVEREMEVLEQPEGAVDPRFGLFNRDILLFKAAVFVSGLYRKVVGRRVTAFAPDNEAFRNLGIRGVRDLLEIPRRDLRALLSYHIVPGRVFSFDLQDGFVHTLAGPAVEVDVNGNIFIDDSQVTEADIFDILFFNGVVHKIDRVLQPPTQTIVEIAIAASQSDNPQFTQLVEAVVAAGLADDLSSEGPFTVFAPTDEAFENLLSVLGVGSVDDLDPALLVDVLLYHVVPARVFSSDLSSGTVQTLNGPIEIDASALTIDDAGTDTDANIIGTDIQGTNGVIHVIDKVLLP